MKPTGRFRIRQWYDTWHGFFCYDYVQVEVKNWLGKISWQRGWDDGYSKRSDEELKLSRNEWMIKTYPGFYEIKHGIDEEGIQEIRKAKSIMKLAKKGIYI